MSVQARVLIVASDDAHIGALAHGLDRLEWRTVTARSPFAALAALSDLQIEAAIIDISTGTDEVLGLARRLKAACAPRRLPVMAIGDPDPALDRFGFDLILSSPIHPAQAGMRLRTLVRMAIAEEEFALRLETFAERGRRLELVETPVDPYRILAVGEPAPQFLALSNALASTGVDVVGAFTAYTAFDYLHERTFDAVVLWADGDQSEAVSIAAGIRRNTRLYHIPALLYQRSEDQASINEAFHRGISDVATSEAAEIETAHRVVELARGYRRQTAIRSALERARSSGLMDAATGLFTRDLFASHLARLAAAAKARNRPLSVCVLRLADRPDIASARAGGGLDRAIPQIGSMIGRLVRAEDTAARLGPEIFALALPATPQAAARAVAERIVAVIGCTAFEAGGGRTPFVVSFDIGIAIIQDGEGAAAALERAATSALRREAS